MSVSPGLSPPPPIRHRASSSARPPLIISTIGRRRSSSNLAVDSPVALLYQPAISPVPVPSLPPASPSMLFIIASRILQLLQVQQKNLSSWSTPSSPRSSTDDSVLPLSAPPTPTSFTHSFSEKGSSLKPQFQLSVHGPILFVLMLFPLSTALVLFSLSTLPISMAWPRTLTDLAHLGGELHSYSQSGTVPMAHVVGVMAITAVWKHAWSIPGSVIWNVLAGALFSPALATLLLTSLTTIGSVCATVLSKPLAPFLTHLFPSAVNMTRNAIEGGSGPDVNAEKAGSSAWVRLSVLRLIGVVPWSGINVACGICGVAISDCFLGAFIGSLPWTAVTCQIGDILQTVASAPSPTPQTVSSLLTSPEIVVKLACLSFLSLAPILGRERLRSLITHSASPKPTEMPSAADDERMPRWAWVHDWRARIRMPSRSQSRAPGQQELDALMSEKEGLLS